MRQQILKTLAELRSKGVARRNLGLSLREKPAKHERWIETIYGTEQDILELVSKISPAEAQKLTTLNTVPQIMVALSDEERNFVRTFNNFNERLDRLNILIEKYLTPELIE